MSKICKKRVYGNEKMDLPGVFFECTRSLHFTLILAPIIFHIAKLPLEKLPQDIYFNTASFAKIIIICENNYSHENNERFIVDVRQGFEYASNFEYARIRNMFLVLNMLGFWIDYSYEIYQVIQGFKYV